MSRESPKKHLLEMTVLRSAVQLGGYEVWHLRYFFKKNAVNILKWFLRCGLKIPSRGQALWCRTVILSDRNFSSQQTAFVDSFSCMYFLLQLHSSLDMCYLINFMLKYLIFQLRTVQFGSSQQRWWQNIWRNSLKKTDVRLPDVMNEILLTPPVYNTERITLIKLSQVEKGIIFGLLVKIHQ